MLSKISSRIAAHLVYLAIGVAALSLAVPEVFIRIPSSSVSPMLGIVMFGELDISGDKYVVKS